MPNMMVFGGGTFVGDCPEGGTLMNGAGALVKRSQRAPLPLAEKTTEHYTSRCL